MVPPWHSLIRFWECFGSFWKLAASAVAPAAAAAAAAAVAAAAAAVSPSQNQALADNLSDLLPYVAKQSSPGTRILCFTVSVLGERASRSSLV